MIKAALMTPMHEGVWGLPLVLRGEPGTAKTATMAQIARDLGMFLYVFIGSVREPQDILGLPFPAKDKYERVITQVAAPGWGVQLGEKPRAILFLDELSCNAPAMQAAMLRVVNERFMGDQPLGEGVRIIAAMNETVDAAGGWDLAAPMANRFGHIVWPAPSADELSSYLVRLGSGRIEQARLQPSGDGEATEQRVLELWPEALQRSSVLVASFLKARQELAHQKPDAHSDASSQAWPSARSWELATRALASAEIFGFDAELSERFMGAFVGTGAVAEYAQWRRTADLPDPADILDNKVSWKHNPARLDLTFAVLNGCAHLVTNTNGDGQQRRVARMWSMIGEVAESAADLAIEAALTLEANDLVFGDMPECEAALSGPIFSVMEAAREL
jgi:MoxR-like ATPase